MSEKKGYTHVKAVEQQVLQMLAEGKSQREVAEHFGFRNKIVVKELVRRYKYKQREIAAGITPCRRGRPPKGYVPTNQEKDNEIKRLKMEIELLRSFLQIAGRK